ncbi:CBS domain-containing protein [Actinoplanes sp. NPDC049802]|uniref:CBS domain-containing protein n=1 Tax=Actinoplanes sp. NPDC049802 TaxID=3154742 RepID=UPI0034089BF3
MRTWTVDDVMTREVVAVPPETGYRELVDLLIGRQISAVPVVDADRRVVGVVSEADLLYKIEIDGRGRLFEGRRRRGQRAKAFAATADHLMSAPPIVVRQGTVLAAAARVMESQHVKRLPVVDDRDRLCGIVTRGDLLRIHLRGDDEIRADVVSGVLGAFFPDEAASVTVGVADGVVTLTGRVGRCSTAELMVRLTRQVAGVVRVADRLGFEFDDRPAWPEVRHSS